ncbi:MAG: response regulator, partial [Melioribacteraceae bacterium]
MKKGGIHLKVLVVDDEKWIRKGIVSKLKGLADEVEFTGEAQSGREALTLFDNCPADLVITDIKMPDMDGLELIKDIKSRGLDTKFIIISGYAEFDFAKKAIELSVKKYLLKPIMEEDIVNAVKSIMNEVKQNNAIQKKVNDIALNRDKLLIEKILNKIIHSEIDDLEFENMMDYFPYLRNTYVMLICFEINSKDKKAAQSFMDLIIEQTYKYGE